ncbi:MAG: zinc metallopeptidase [Gammaproteobacteria bacterium]
MHFIVLILFLLLLIFGPQLWAKATFKRYSTPLDSIPGTGGEFARHLLAQLDISDVSVEETQPGGDHYDPQSRTVRLSPENYRVNSLTAITVAAHEVGHAIQHDKNEKKLKWRTQLVHFSQASQKMGSAAMLLVPVVTAITRSPNAGLLMIVLGLISLLSATLVHLITLPVELDASFRKALPILKQGKYINTKDEPATKKILQAAAWTYVAASLASVLNIWRWMALLKRAR